MKWLVLSLMMLGTAFSQTTTSSDQVSLQQLKKSKQLEDPNFLKIINNYFGCKTWQDGICQQCSQGFYFNKNGVCCQIKQHCKEFNTNVGVCDKCYDGYQLVDNSCKILDFTNIKNKGCRKFDGGLCVQCSQRFYFKSEGVCQQIDGNCRSWQQNGTCNQCYVGYKPNGNVCEINNKSINNVVDEFGNLVSGLTGQPKTLVQINPLCKTWKDTNCLQCSDRSFLNSNLICQQVDGFCKTWDRANGVCLSCYNGFKAIDGKCVLIKNPKQGNNGIITVGGLTGIDSNGDGIIDFCKVWDNLTCLQCVPRAYFDSNKVCQPVQDLCQQWNQLTGQCTKCYLGYTLNLQSKFCERNPFDLADAPKDLGCKVWDWQNQICKQCSLRWKFNNEGVCFPLDNLCQQFNQDGSCKKCYVGYQVGANNICILSQIQKVKDLGCAVWDWQNQICLECSIKYKFDQQKKCVVLDNLCEQFDSNKNCVKCYKGFQMGANGLCVEKIQQVQDLGCAIWDWDNQKCLQCSKRWYFSKQGKCQKIDDLCQIFQESSGVCTKCYKGFDLADGLCTASLLNSIQPVDPGCKVWDWDKQVCLECSFRWYFGSQGKCVKVDDLCQTHNNGVCSKCFKGFVLSQDNICVIDNRFQQVSDLGCAVWDWDNQICLECSKRWYLNKQRKCQAIDNLCETFEKGVCVKCFKGYDLANGLCVLGNQPQVKDLGCAIWDWDNQICIQCSKRWFFNKQGKCQKIDDYCQAYQESTGVCSKCYNGYIIQNGICVLGNPLCKQSNAKGECTSCYNGFVLYKNNCWSLAKIANKALYYQQCCPELLNTLK